MAVEGSVAGAWGGIGTAVAVELAVIDEAGNVEYVGRTYRTSFCHMGGGKG